MDTGSQLELPSGVGGLSWVALIWGLGVEKCFSSGFTHHTLTDKNNGNVAFANEYCCEICITVCHLDKWLPLSCRFNNSNVPHRRGLCEGAAEQCKGSGQSLQIQFIFPSIYSNKLTGRLTGAQWGDGGWAAPRLKGGTQRKKWTNTCCTCSVSGRPSMT